MWSKRPSKRCAGRTSVLHFPRRSVVKTAWRRNYSGWLDSFVDGQRAGGKQRPLLDLALLVLETLQGEITANNPAVTSLAAFMARTKLYICNDNFTTLFRPRIVGRMNTTYQRFMCVLRLGIIVKFFGVCFSIFCVKLSCRHIESSFIIYYLISL